MRKLRYAMVGGGQGAFIGAVHRKAMALDGQMEFVAGAPITLQRVLGLVMAPVCWLMGIPWSEATTAGSLMGVKTILNELIAYLQLAALPADALSPRSRLIMLYAMCGFANFGSVGIIIGGLSALVPERRADVVQLAMRAMISGTMASGLTGAIIGLLPINLAGA